MLSKYLKPNIQVLSNVADAILGIMLLLILIIYYQYQNRPTEQYYVTTPQGKSSRILPLQQPNVDTRTLLSWATLAITASYSFDFVNYENTLQDIRKYYTTAGYDNFIDALNTNNLLEDVQSKKLIVSAVPIGTPVIVHEGIMKDYYAWNIQVPLLISFQGPNETRRLKHSVSLLVTRVPTIDAPKGIGIAQFVLSGIKT